MTRPSATSGLAGPLVSVPYRFTAAIVRQVVREPGPGVYALGRDDSGFLIGYVGRSDHSVRDRLAGHERKGEFDYFIVRYANSAESAYRLECAFWHASIESGGRLVNVIHPATPRDLGLQCPYCHFASHVCRLLAPLITKDCTGPSRDYARPNVTGERGSK